MARVIRLGVIGTGLALRKLHWPALRQLPEQFRVVAFAEAVGQQAEEFADYTGLGMAGHHRDYRELLRRDDVEAVLIALPIPLLYPVTREALTAGKDVFCEKPTGTDEAQGREFLALEAEFPGRRVLIAENFFYRDELRQARALIDAGAIGRLHLVSWRMVSQLIPQAGQFSSTPWRQRTQYRGGPHLDAGVHHVAQIRLLCGDIREVYGALQSANRTIDAPSDLTLNLRFVNGAVGNYTACYPELAMPHEPNELRLYGTEGVLVVGQDQEGRWVTLHRPDGSAEQHRFIGSDNGYYNEWRNFYDAIVHGEPIVGTIAQSFHNLLIIMRALDSAERGTPLTLDDAPGELAATSLPLWRPRGAAGLFEGLPGEHVVEQRAG